MGGAIGGGAKWVGGATVWLSHERGRGQKSGWGYGLVSATGVGVANVVGGAKEVGVDTGMTGLCEGAGLKKWAWLRSGLGYGRGRGYGSGRG